MELDLIIPAQFCFLSQTLAIWEPKTGQWEDRDNVTPKIFTYLNFSLDWCGWAVQRLFRPLSGWRVSRVCHPHVTQQWEGHCMESSWYFSSATNSAAGTALTSVQCCEWTTASLGLFIDLFINDYWASHPLVSIKPEQASKQAIAMQC